MREEVVVRLTGKGRGTWRWNEAAATKTRVLVTLNSRASETCEVCIILLSLTARKGGGLVCFGGQIPRWFRRYISFGTNRPRMCCE